MKTIIILYSSVHVCTETDLHNSDIVVSRWCYGFSACVVIGGGFLLLLKICKAIMLGSTNLLSQNTV